MNGYEALLLFALWVIGMMLANHEVRLRHNGYHYYVDADGRVRHELPLEFDFESCKWWPIILSWLIWLPYRLYRIKHPIHPPTVTELADRRSTP